MNSDYVKYPRKPPVMHKLNLEVGRVSRDKAEVEQKKAALSKALVASTATGLLQGKIKAPKFKAEGDIEAIQAGRKDIRGQLRKDF